MKDASIEKLLRMPHQEKLFKQLENLPPALADEKRTRYHHIATLCHEKYMNPAFNIYKHVPNITEDELNYFNEQFTLMKKDYRSE